MKTERDREQSIQNINVLDINGSILWEDAKKELQAETKKEAV